MLLASFHEFVPEKVLVVFVVILIRYIAKSVDEALFLSLVKYVKRQRFLRVK
jgi:hypothetical protein